MLPGLRVHIVYLPPLSRTQLPSVIRPFGFVRPPSRMQPASHSLFSTTLNMKIGTRNIICSFSRSQLFPKPYVIFCNGLIIKMLILCIFFGFLIAANLREGTRSARASERFKFPHRLLECP